MKVGNLDVERDILDVRDVAEAYVDAVIRSDRIAPGTPLNICTGQATRIRSVLDNLIALSTCAIAVETDPARWRDTDTPNLVGDPAAAGVVLGWTAKRSIRQLLIDMIEIRRRS